ncbi:hypothetical protein GCM10009800_46490 [Nocardiopsis rhodophaea]
MGRREKTVPRVGGHAAVRPPDPATLACMERPYTILSCAMSVDGYIDDASPDRLRLSSEEDFDEVDELRARCDAILVGAGTVRRDNPRLLVRSAERRQRREAEGRPGHLLKVVLTENGELDPRARFFTTGDAGKIVYTASGTYPACVERFRDAPDDVTVVDAGAPTDPARILADLGRRGVHRLLVEGGSRVHTLFLTAGLADEIRLAVAPFFVGDADAPRFVDAGAFANGPDHPMRLAEARTIGDIVVLRYLTGRPA